MQVESSSVSFENGVPVLDLSQGAQEIVTRVATPVGQKLKEVLRELEHTFVPRRDDFWREEKIGIEASCQRIRPDLETILILERYAEEIADDPDRQRIGEILHEIDITGLDGSVEKLVDHLLGSIPQRLHHLRGEGLGDEAPESGVVGRISEKEGAHLEHGRRNRIVFLHGRAKARRHALVGNVEAVRARPPVPQHGQAVSMPSHHPETEFAPRDGRPLSQIGVERKGITRPPGVKRVERGADS